MNTQLIPLTSNKLPTLPAFAHVEDEFSSGIRVGFPVVSIKGKVFTLVRGDERTLITRPGSDGEPEPAQSLEVVIVRSNRGLSKTYFEGGYVEGESAAPVCYSNNGESPAEDAESPQAKSCAACPHNKWGSRITEDGKKAKACADGKRLAVVPLGRRDDPMLLRVPATSLKALFEFDAELKRRGLSIPVVATKISFDFSAAYPSLTFKPVGILPDEILKEIEALRENDTVLTITGGTITATELAADAPETVEEEIPQMATSDFGEKAESEKADESKKAAKGNGRGRKAKEPEPEKAAPVEVSDPLLDELDATLESMGF